MEKYKSCSCTHFLSFSIVLTTLVSCLALTSADIPLQNRTWPTRNYNGQIGFPSYGVIGDLINQLSGTYVSALEPTYPNASAMHNLRVTRMPAVIIYPKTTQDIQKIVLFVRKYNLHLCIRSSGHSYIGRSTHGGAVVLNLALMKDIDINLTSDRNPAGEVKVQSGASWIEVYAKLNGISGPDASGSGNVGRVIVGGSAHSVAMGGYTQGGGHSPIGRKFGLAVDNVLEVTLVTVDGKVMTLSADKTITVEIDGSKNISADTSLFWAIRGGGGGTWGTVVSFTYKLHYAPQRFRNLLVLYPMYTDKGVPIYQDNIHMALNLLTNLTEDWGGYIAISPTPVTGTTLYGNLLLFMNHYGNDSSPSNHDIDGLLSKTKPIYVNQTNYPTFLDYEVHANDAPFYNTYIANTFVQQSTLKDPAKLESFTNFLYKLVKDNMGCTLTMIGGKVMQSHSRPATPVHPAFRNGIFSASCGLGWSYNPTKDPMNIQKALVMAQQLYTHGDGSYFNEPAEDMPDWKQRFWADSATYQKLLNIKKHYDPDNYFWCHNCVGSDLGKNYGPPTNEGLPGRQQDGKQEL